MSAAAQRAECQPGGIRIAPFAPQHLALARRQCAEEVVEAGVAGVLPMELHAEPLQPAGVAEFLPFMLGAEGDMHRRQVERPAGLFQRRGQRCDRHAGIRVTQQARARRRTERCGDLQLRIVVATGPFQRMRPAVIEHIFAVAVGLGVHRRHRDDLPRLAAQHGVLRQPSGAGIGGPAVLHGTQERVADKRIVRPGAGVPLGGGNIGDLLVQCQRERRGTVGHDAEPNRSRTFPLPPPRRPQAGPARRSWCGHDVRPRRTPPRPGPMRRSSPVRAG